MTLKLNPEHLQIIYTHAENTYPEECCGVMLGYLDDESKTVVEVIPTANAWNTEAENFAEVNTKHSHKDRYAIAPQTMLQLQREARSRSLSIIGIFHSHPDHPAVPSECDRLYAWPLYSYIIVSVINGKASELLSWSLNEHHQFEAEAIAHLNLSNS
ncbi:MAG TPA: M67 family metallopeptidase [Nostocaceae cyanobacterium]|nr:M67 family metallopeptidase [Nostocaceae cyanobacterium]